LTVLIGYLLKQLNYYKVTMENRLKISVFPGWSYNNKMSEYFGFKVDCHDHFEQISLFENETQIKNLIPNSPWGLITWSMGTWTAIKLRSHWKNNPPVFWITLAPFLEFCGPQSIPLKNIDSLISSINKKPIQTLRHFRKCHGGINLFNDNLYTQEKINTLIHSLELLKVSPKFNEFNDCPVLIIYGNKDTLVNKHMLKSFQQNCPNHKIQKFDGLKHDLLYEEPEEIKETIITYINKHLNGSF
jgi:hypothetical protein